MDVGLFITIPESACNVSTVLFIYFTLIVFAYVNVLNYAQKVRTKYVVVCNCTLTGGKITKLFLIGITEMLLDLEAVIDSYEVSSEKGLTKPGR